MLFQHTPAMRLGVIHDSFAEGEKQFSLEGFSKEIRNHLLCRTIMDVKFTSIDTIGDKEIVDVEMLGTP